MINIKKNPKSPGNIMLATFDFSAHFTTLPHEDLIRKYTTKG